MIVVLMTMRGNVNNANNNDKSERENSSNTAEVCKYMQIILMIIN